MSGRLTRRGFASLAAAPMLASPNRKIRTAVIGTTHGHALSKIRALRSMPEYELAGVCRVEPGDPPDKPELRGVPWLPLDQVLRKISQPTPQRGASKEAPTLPARTGAFAGDTLEEVAAPVIPLPPFAFRDVAHCRWATALV